MNSTQPRRCPPAPPQIQVPMRQRGADIAALDCNIARIVIERDFLRLPECATLPETNRRSRKKSEARLRDEARRQRCQRLMADLELASACGRPDIAAYATQLWAEMRQSDQ